MPDTFAEKHLSFWIDTTPRTNYPPMPGDGSVDVAVLGGGITGLTAAVLLKRLGKTAKRTFSWLGQNRDGLEGLRTVSRDKRGVWLRRYDARGGETFDPLVRLFGRSRRCFLGNSRKGIKRGSRLLRFDPLPASCHR